jgi:hypothetical protein
LQLGTGARSPDFYFGLGGPTVAVSATNVFVSWTSEPYTAHVEERQAGAWSGVDPVSNHTVANRVVAQGTKARLLYDDDEVIKQT